MGMGPGLGLLVVVIIVVEITKISSKDDWADADWMIGNRLKNSWKSEGCWWLHRSEINGTIKRIKGRRMDCWCHNRKSKSFSGR